MKDNFSVEKIPSSETWEWLLKKHYAKRIPSISYAFGLYEDLKLCGVCTFGTPSSSTLLKGVAGEKYYYDVIELNRLVVESSEPNITSWFVSRCLSLINNKIIVSYADTSQGHIGKIYQACNFIYTGLSILTYDPVVKGHEGKHHSTSGMGRGMTKAAMKAKYGDDVHWKPRDRKHRYIYITGDKKFRREALKNLKYEIQPYPKGDTQRYDASYKPKVQGILF